ncbi:sugar dehydrogenase complex small subunit [Paraburkholderia bonniea]|uniref:sugar dehydrogenase complex small subunit n=1 Tax=Paraburkholderia bonniea TaxID=2152891 RepID=UPI0012922385|nr:sugar dehydrogenase complex small subunit [Paraburkholderia bonniea]
MAEVQQDPRGARPPIASAPPASALPAFPPVSPASSIASMRRRWLLGAGASAAVLAFTLAAGGFSLKPAWAAGLSDSSYVAFLSVSRQLSGRSDFNLVLAQRIYTALSKAERQFTRDVGVLERWLENHRGTPSDTVMQALQASQPELLAPARAILQAWYLGLVGKHLTTRVVAFEQALMFAPVLDVLTIPSYCRDVPFYWTQKPGQS